MGTIEILSPSLLKEYKDELKTIDHWLSVLNWSNGWHYDLDLLWILKQIKALNLKKGATILEAGAGLGVNQFLLSSMGFNVISLDFTYRKAPKLTKNIFTIRSDQENFKDPSHDYMKFMNYGQKKSSLQELLKWKKWQAALKQPDKVYYILKKNLCNHVNIKYLLETLKDHKNFGEITFLRGSFNNIPLPDQSVDLLVSISAFEHNTYSDMPHSVKEFARVTKKGGQLLVTTSLTKDKDWFFEPSKGWNFTAETLQRWFEIESTKNIDFDKGLQMIRTSKDLEARIPPFYRYNGVNGLPFANLKEAQYIPCGIIKNIS